jgi:hypothetical protein
MSLKRTSQIDKRGMMRLIKTLFMAALFSSLASYSHACAVVDGVAAKTDTTITISWDVSGCRKRLSAYNTFRVCWKYAGNWGNACIPPTIDKDGETGTTTITGLSPQTPYRIRTLWHHRSWGWLDVMTRTVTTSSSQWSYSASNQIAPFSLRYEKDSRHRYCVNFYWKNVPPGGATSINLLLGRKFLFFWVAEDKSPDVTHAPFNLKTGEYYYQWCKFYEARTYEAAIATSSHGNIIAQSNTIVWH